MTIFHHSVQLSSVFRTKPLPEWQIITTRDALDNDSYKQLIFVGCLLCIDTFHKLCH